MLHPPTKYMMAVPAESSNAIRTQIYLLREDALPPAVADGVGLSYRAGKESARWMTLVAKHLGGDIIVQIVSLSLSSTMPTGMINRVSCRMRSSIVIKGQRRSSPSRKKSKLKLPTSRLRSFPNGKAPFLSSNSHSLLISLYPT
jgi:hypothetical protein